jgi:hypothetical protein
MFDLNGDGDVDAKEFEAVQVGEKSADSLTVCQIGRILPLFVKTRARVKQRGLTRVARWYIFRAKIPIWVYFGGLEMINIGIFYGHL